MEEDNCKNNAFDKDNSVSLWVYYGVLDSQGYITPIGSTLCSGQKVPTVLKYGTMNIAKPIGYDPFVPLTQGSSNQVIIDMQITTLYIRDWYGQPLEAFVLGVKVANVSIDTVGNITFSDIREYSQTDTSSIISWSNYTPGIFCVASGDTSKANVPLASAYMTKVDISTTSNAAIQQFHLDKFISMY